MVLSCNSGHPANNFDGHKKKWLSIGFDVVIRIQSAISFVLLYAYRHVKVSLQCVHYKCRFEMQSYDMAQERAPVKKNFSSKPTTQVTDDVLLTLTHVHLIVNHPNASVLCH